MDNSQNYQMMNNFNNFNNINPLFNNGNLFYMQNQLPNNFNQMNFGNQMLMNNNPMMMQMNNNTQNDIEDVYDYIKEPKKKVIFLRVLDNKSFNILIPCSLRKNELYCTAISYKKFDHSEIQLFHNEKFLNDDETSIDCINEGDEIKIIEQLHGIDFSYYDLYLSKHKKEPLINIILYSNNIKGKTFCFTLNTSIEEMIKIICNELCIPENQREEYFFLMNGKKLSFYDKSTLFQNRIKNFTRIYTIRTKNITLFNYLNGRCLGVTIKDKNKIICNKFTGTLNTIKQFYEFIYVNEFKNRNISLKKIIINGKEFQKDDERTFSSLGIRKNFICNVELNENH